MIDLYFVIEEATEALVANHTNLYEAKMDAESRGGKYYVIDNSNNILYESKPGISYKI